MWANPLCSTALSATSGPGRRPARRDARPARRRRTSGRPAFYSDRHGGLEDATDDSLQGRMRRLTERAVDMADVCLFMIDARTGVTPIDEMFAEILRKRSKHVILAANKAEGNAADAGVLEAFNLGLGEPVRLSGEHGEGMADLYDHLMPLADAADVQVDDDTP